MALASEDAESPLPPEDVEKLKEPEHLNLMVSETPPAAYLNFTLGSEDVNYPGTSGEGWTWDPATKTLNLNGLTLNEFLLVELSAAYEFAILVPDGSTIIATGSNFVNSPNGNGIVCDGDLLIKGTGNLNVQAYYSSIRATGNLDIRELADLTLYSQYESGLRVGPGDSSVNQDGGHLTINNVGDLSVSSYSSALRVLGDVTIAGFDLVSLTSDSYSGIRAGPDYDVERHTESAGNVYITNGNTFNIQSYESGMRLMGGNVLVELVDHLSVVSEDHTAIHAAPYDIDYFEGLGILEKGHVEITDCGIVHLQAYYNGIRNSGNTKLNAIDDLTIQSQYSSAIRSGPDDDGDQDTGVDGDVTIQNCGSVAMESEENGIRTLGNLNLNQIETMTIYTDEESGLRVGPGSDNQSGSNGNAFITDVGTLTIDAGFMGMRVIGDLAIEGVELLDINARTHTGIRVGLGDPDIIVEGNGDALIRNCETVQIVSEHNGMRITGNLTVDDVDDFTIHSDWTGLRVGNSYYQESNGDWSQSDSPGDVLLKNIDSMDIMGNNKGINSTGSTTLEQCLGASVVAITENVSDGYGYGILAGTGITVKQSHLIAYGSQFGLVTGWAYNEYNQSPGGDILIDQSYVEASSAADLNPMSLKAYGSGYAAIFAGDDPEGEEHSVITLTKAVFKDPTDAYVADVEIGEFTCQSITNEEELDGEVISDWSQALNRVVIEPLYQVTYDGNGATGSVTDLEGPYLTDATVTVLDNGYTLLGYTFDSWNTKVDGSGTDYAPEDTFPIAGNTTLYAQWNKIPPVVNYNETDPETGTITDGMKTNVTLPEMTDPMTKEILVYVDVKSASLDPALRTQILAKMTEEGYELLDVLDITLMKRITGFDDSVVTEVIPNSDITGMITVRVLLTGDQVAKDNLAIAYISDAGEITILTGTKVTLNGKTYLEFQTNHFSNYALVQALGDQEVNPATGLDATAAEDKNASGMAAAAGAMSLLILASGILLIGGQRRKGAK